MDGPAQQATEHDAPAGPAGRVADARVAGASRLQRVVGALFFPMVLWWIGSFFLLGNLGRWLDDYGFHLRDPATDTFKVSWLFRWHQAAFWRPLHMMVVQDLITLTWHGFWVAHLVCALVHLLNVLLLFRVLRRLGVRRTVASGCGVLFLTLPMGYEAIFWPSTLSTGIALAIFQGIMLRYARVVARERWGKWEWTWAALLLPAMFIIACFYEQALTMLSCLPFVYLGLAPRLARVRAHAVRLVVPLALGTAGGVVYAVLLVRSAGSTIRGGAGSFTAPGELADQAALIAGQAWGFMTMKWFLPGAVRTGWETIGRHWTGGIAVVVMLMLSGAAWLAWRWRLIREEQAGAEGSDAAGRRRAAMLVLGGLAVFVLAWLPMVVIRGQWAAPRMCYIPLFGAMMMIGGALELAARGLTRRARAQRVVLMGVGVMTLQIAVTGVIALVGVQTAYQRRWRMDQEQMAELRRLVPQPPAETVFMPVRLQDWPAATGCLHFDGLLGVWDLPWASHLAIRQTYRTNAVHAFNLNRWLPIPLSRVTAQDFVYTGKFSSQHPQLPDGRHVVPWSAVVPFMVDQDHKLWLVERLVVMRKGERLAEVEPPLVQRAKEGTPGGPFVREVVIEVKGE